MGFLAGKRILIIGLISDKSIAAGIATAMQREGAALGFTYQSENFQSKIKELAEKWDSEITIPCDLASDEDLQRAFEILSTKWEQVDGFVHAVAYAPGDQLSGLYHDVLTKEAFRIAHDLSSYSFGALARASLPMIQNRRSALLTLSYHLMDQEKASLEENVRYLAYSLGPLNIRVNGISAGPVASLASPEVKGYKEMLTHHRQVSPLRRNIDVDEIGNAAAFLCSDLASGITGEILHVDAGYNIIKMADLD